MLILRSLAAALVLGLTLAGPAAHANVFHFGGVTHGGGAGETPLSAAVTTTAAGAAFLASCDPFGIGPAYPPQQEWDGSKLVGNQPRAATEAMGLTPKIEQYRGGVLVATWGRFSSTNPCILSGRADDPGSVGSLACLGPFGQSGNMAWKEGDSFLVYPAVYKEGIYLSTNNKRTVTTSVTVGGTQINLGTTADLLVNDAIASGTYISPDTHILSIDSGSLVTISHPVLATSASASLTIKRNFENITISGVTQNVGGIPTRPTVMYDDSADLTQTGNKGLLQVWQFDDADIRNFIWENIDVEVKKPPYGQQSWGAQNEPWNLILLSGTQIQDKVTFRNMRIHGGKYMAYPAGANGMGSGNVSTVRDNHGEVIIDHVNSYENGGQQGPSHNFYFGDGHFYKLTFTNNWSHDVNNGHLLKSRSLNNVITGNYFEDAEITAYTSFGESNNVDLPCGGAVVMKNNIMTRRHNGDAKNYIMFFFGEDSRCSAVYSRAEVSGKHFEVKNNTFALFGKMQEGGMVGETTSAIDMYPPLTSPATPVIPGDADFPTTDATVANNVFAGICPSNINSKFDFPWSVSHPSTSGPNIYAGLSDLNLSLGLTTDYVPASDRTNVGATSYAHPASAGVRALNTFGAVDSYVGTAMPAARPDVFVLSDIYHYQIGNGDTTHIRWNSTGATAGTCVASGGFSGSLSGIQGNFLVTPPPNATTTYTVSCSGPTGTGSDSVTVETFDVPTLTVTPNVTTTSGPNQPVSFNIVTTNANYCTWSGGTINAERSNYVRTFFPASTRVYSLDCTGAAGMTARQDTRITVTGTNPRPSAYLYKDQASISKALGDSFTITWSSFDADTCTGVGFSTLGATFGSVDVQPSATVTASLTCNSAAGGNSLTPTQILYVFP